MNEAVALPTGNALGATKLPAHVAPELVRPFPYILGATTTRRPHDFIAEIHQGPPVFWGGKCL